MEASEFRGLQDDALREELETRRRKLLETRCQIALGEDVRPHQVREAKRDIARILTILRERQTTQTAAVAGGQG